MNKENILQKVSYKERLAFSLINYAHRSPHFSLFLKRSVPKSEEQLFADPENTKIIEPYDDLMAIKRAEWLIENSSENEECLKILGSFVSTREDPKQIIIGIAPTDILGVTIGQIKKKVFMTIIVDDKDLLSKKMEFAEKVTRVSLNLFRLSLEEASGDVKKIEPEIADWFFGEKKISFFLSNKKELKKIKRELKSCDLDFTEEEGLIAITPVLNGDNAFLYWNMTPIN